MKNILFTSIINIIVFGCLIGQSNTIEIMPTFHKGNTAFITQKIDFPNPAEALEFIGLSCYHFDTENVDIFYRLKTENQWSQWLTLEQQHEFVESSRSAYKTKPILKTFTDIQFKTSKKLSTSLTVRFFLATLDNSPYQTMERSLDCELPEICERVCWCPSCPIDISPEFTVPTHLIVHHSAGNNQSNNFATVVEYYWDLHVKTNGWDDIGYNWLVDPNGILYEGRPDKYQGAHFSCLNENTVGICVIGDYSLVQPTEAALNTLVNLLAFEATENNIDILEKSYHVTGDFILDNLAGHRDSAGSTHACSATVCPGNSFYPILGDLRQQVAELPCYNNVSSTTEEHDGIESIKVFPNPIDQYLFIKSDKPQIQTIEIIDIYGRSFGFVSTEKENDLSHLKPGIYFLIFNGELLEKFIKK